MPPQGSLTWLSLNREGVYSFYSLKGKSLLWRVDERRQQPIEHIGIQAVPQEVGADG